MAPINTINRLSALERWRGRKTFLSLMATMEKVKNIQQISTVVISFVVEDQNKCIRNFITTEYFLHTSMSFYQITVPIFIFGKNSIKEFFINLLIGYKTYCKYVCLYPQPVNYVGK